ncbi:hypothetical protein LSH36_36g05005 [Paralvinella palmiformis]|uniref:L-type lectin-like domain-containing protein n=1 Tax=Paralvinella palmiformis TaxID=53620 RepID=A0AAD9K8J7_9ANNE|nr:hypothetical protein LSH36_36g05005 [Paralvinella palmiformis]
MANFNNIGTNIICIILHYVLVLVQSETNDYMKREHSLIKPYSDGRWDIMGSAIITNNFVRLTSDHQSRRGSVWNNVPNRLRDWEMHVQFKVHGDVFGSKDKFHGLGIFMDTYSNHNGPHNHGHPYISAMVNNGTFSYDHDRDGTHTELAGCESQFRKVPHDTFIAIRYESNQLTVSTDIEGKNNWKECFSVAGVRLPTGYYFGASAATGDLADNHEIISIKLYDISDDSKDVEDGVDYSRIEPSADFFAPPRDHIEDPKGSFLSSKMTGGRLFIIIFLVIIGLGVCAMVGFVIFSKNQESSRKRFY